MLRVTTKTWTRDSHDLYDYEAQHVNKRSFLISTSVRFFRSRACVICVEDSSDELPEDRQDLLFQVQSYEHQGNREYLIFPGNLTGNNEMHNLKKLWSIVSRTTLGYHVLQIGDIIKLGRFRLKIRNFALCKSEFTMASLSDTEPLLMEDIAEGEVAQCRICLNEGDTEDDPLICPCDCNGSIKYAHFSCLQKWICGRRCIETESRTGSVFIRDLVCELCKKEFPRSVKKGDRVMHFISIPESLFPIMVLDSMNYSNVRGIHIISFARKTQIKIGRGHECDFRIPDVSISRLHATITYIEGQFRLMDQKSKFGTLVAIQRAVVLNSNTPFIFQVGRSIVDVVISLTERFIPGIARMIEDITVLDHPPNGNNLLTDAQEEDPEGTTQTNRVAPNQHVAPNVNISLRNASLGEVIVLDEQEDATTFVRRVRRNTATNTPTNAREITENRAPLGTNATNDASNRNSSNISSERNAQGESSRNDQPADNALSVINSNDLEEPVMTEDHQSSEEDEQMLERSREALRRYYDRLANSGVLDLFENEPTPLILELERIIREYENNANLATANMDRSERSNDTSGGNPNAHGTAARCVFCERIRSEWGDNANLEILHVSHIEHQRVLNRVLRDRNNNEQARVRFRYYQIIVGVEGDENNIIVHNGPIRSTGNERRNSLDPNAHILIRITRREPSGEQESRYIVGTPDSSNNSIMGHTFNELLTIRSVVGERDEEEFYRALQTIGNRRYNARINGGQRNNEETYSTQESMDGESSSEERNEQANYIEVSSEQENSSEESSEQESSIDENNEQIETVQGNVEEGISETSSEENIQRNTRRTGVDRTPDAHGERITEREVEHITERTAEGSSNIMNRNSQGTPATIVIEENVTSELPERTEESNITAGTNNMNRTASREEEGNNVNVEEEVIVIEEEEENAYERREERETSVGIQRTREERREMVSERNGRRVNRNRISSNQNHGSEGNRNRQRERSQVENRRRDNDRDAQRDGSEDNSDEESEDNSDDAEEMNKKNNDDDDDERHNDGTGTVNRRGSARTSRAGITGTGIMNRMRNRQNRNHRTQNGTNRFAGIYEAGRSPYSFDSDSNMERARKRSVAIQKLIQEIKKRKENDGSNSDSSTRNKRASQQTENDDLDELVMEGMDMQFPCNYCTQSSIRTNHNADREGRSQDRKRKSDDFIERAKEHLRKNLARLENNEAFLRQSFGKEAEIFFNNKKFKKNERNADNTDEEECESLKGKLKEKLNNIKELFQNKNENKSSSSFEVKNAFRHGNANPLNETLNRLTQVSDALKREIKEMKESCNRNQVRALCNKCICCLNERGPTTLQETNENNTTNGRENVNQSDNQRKRSRSFSLLNDRAKLRRDILGKNASDELNFFARNNNRSLLGNIADLNEEFLKAFGIKRNTGGNAENAPTENNPSLSVVRKSLHAVDSREERGLSDSSVDSFKSALSRESEVLRGIRKTNDAHTNGRTRRVGNRRNCAAPTTDNTPTKTNEQLYRSQ